MGEAILVSRSPGERRVALRGADGRFARYAVERPSLPDGVGDVFRARVARLAPAMAGAFVKTPAEAFLAARDAEGARLPPEGAVLAVRVTRAAQGGKGMRVSALGVPPLPPGPVGLVHRGLDAALRFAALAAEAPVVTDDAAEAARLRAALGPARVGLAARAFDDAAEAEAEALGVPEAAIPGGAGRLLIHPLPALTAVDVDGGTATASKHRDALRELNRRAVAEFARQVELRGLAGPILLDAAGLSHRARRALEPALREAFAADPLCEVLGLGPLGLWELRRARVHAPLHETLAGPLARGLALLRRAAREAQAAPHRALALRAPAPVLDALRALPGALEEHAARAGRALALVETGAGEEITDA